MDLYSHEYIKLIKKTEQYIVHNFLLLKMIGLSSQEHDEIIKKA